MIYWLLADRASGRSAKPSFLKPVNHPMFSFSSFEYPCMKVRLPLTVNSTWLGSFPFSPSSADFDPFKAAYAALGSKLRPLVYELGFLPG